MWRLSLWLGLFSSLAVAQDKELTRGEPFTLQWVSPYTEQAASDQVVWYSVKWECDTGINGQSQELSKDIFSYPIDTEAIYGLCSFRVLWKYNCTPTPDQGDEYKSEEYMVLIKLPKPATGGFR